MAKHHSIPPFPADIDRDAFGHWLSGFVDGEGCFSLRFKPRTATCHQCQARFQLGLRYDDKPILLLIQSYWGCGHLYFEKCLSIQNAHPQFQFDVTGNRDVAEVVVPHFRQYPLRAKKAKDFLVWQEGVALIQQVTRRKRIVSHVKYGGHITRWTQAEIDRFLALVAALKEGRKPECSPISLPKPEPLSPNLFDGLS